MTTKNILITGASSGIGEALAIYYAKQPNTQNLFICGRNRERLNNVKEKCEKFGHVNVHAKVLDVSDKDATRKWIHDSEKTAHLNLVLANAGVWTIEETPENVHTTFNINVMGVVNTVVPIIEIYKKRADEDKILAVTSSIAWYHWLPTCPSFSATKACIKAYWEALRVSLLPYNIQVNTICPWFVHSSITDKNSYFMPFIMKPERAAKLIADGIKRNVWLITFPFILHFVSRLISILPNCISQFIYRCLPNKA